jgi:hypothetical protein
MSCKSAPVTGLLQIVSGFGAAHAIYLAAELGLADNMRDGSKSSEELAQASGMHAPSLRRVLRALASAGLCTEDDQGRYSLTAVGETLRTDVPGTLRAWVRFVLGEECRIAWGGLINSVRTGETAFDNIFGADVWTYRAQHPASARLFDDAMANVSNVYYVAVLATYPFCKFKKLVDVGGGNGSFMVAFLQANPGTTGVLVDMPHVAEKAKQRVAAAALTPRCTVVAGDAFAAVPQGGDAYVLCRVIHDWDDDLAVALLASCRRAMAKTATLLVIERMLPEPVQQAPATQCVCISDLQMMVMNGGRERSHAEYRALYARAGFTLTDVFSTDSGMHVIEGAPA